MSSVLGFLPRPSAVQYICSVLKLLRLWWPQATGQVLGTATTTWSLFLTTSWGQPATTAGGVQGYSLGERGGSARAAGWSGWLLTSPTILWRPEPFGTRSRATAMTSLPMFAMHVWSEPSLVGPAPLALTRMLAFHIWLLLGRLWDHSKQSPMSLFHLSANCESDGPIL